MLSAVARRRDPQARERRRFRVPVVAAHCGLRRAICARLSQRPAIGWRAREQTQEADMRLRIMGVLVPVVLLASLEASDARTFPWCLHDRFGGINCGFVSEQQCRASRGGNTDLCRRNGLYQPHRQGRERARQRR
jgi:hypothetical protein